MGVRFGRVGVRWARKCLLAFGSQLRLNCELGSLHWQEQHLYGQGEASEEGEARELSGPDASEEGEARELSGPDASEEGGSRELAKLQLRQASEEAEATVQLSLS